MTISMVSSVHFQGLSVSSTWWGKSGGCVMTRGVLVTGVSTISAGQGDGGG